MLFISEKFESLVDTETSDIAPSTAERRYEYTGQNMENIITHESVRGEDKFTVMMPFFNRKSTLSNILSHYLKMEKVCLQLLIMLIPVAFI